MGVKVLTERYAANLHGGGRDEACDEDRLPGDHVQEGSGDQEIRRNHAEVNAGHGRHGNQKPGQALRRPAVLPGYRSRLRTASASRFVSARKDIQRDAV